MIEKNIIKTKETNRYFTGIGRRKTSIASVRFTAKAGGQIMVNGKKLEEYFPEVLLQEKIKSPLQLVNLLGKADLTILVRGGGKTGQAEAIRLGIARAIQKYDINLRKPLKIATFLKRDARIKERKKPGLKRARRAPQWQKR
jgi:small subunit ribosomal protein S9